MLIVLDRKICLDFNTTKNIQSRIKSNICDLRNVPKDGGLGGAITAALYLKNFIRPEQKWVHLDVNGATADGMGEAQGLRAMAQVIEKICERYEKEEKDN